MKSVACALAAPLLYLLLSSLLPSAAAEPCPVVCSATTNSTGTDPGATSEEGDVFPQSLCPSWAPSGLSQDAVAVPTCQVAATHHDHAVFVCSAEGHLHGTVWQLYIVDDCGNATTVSLLESAEACRSEVILRRPAFSCGNSTVAAGSSTHETSLIVALGVEGGSIELDAGLHGSVTVPRLATRTPNYTISWVANVDQLITTRPGSDAIEPFSSLLDQGLVGQMLTLTVWYALPPPELEAVLSTDVDLVIPWTAQHCLATETGSQLCARSMSLERSCETATLTVAVEHRCEEQHAQEFLCVEGQVSTKSLSTEVTFPCGTPPVVVSDTLQAASMVNSVVSYTKQVSAEAALTSATGEPQLSWLVEVVVVVYAAVPLDANQTESLQQPIQRLVLLHDGRVTGHGWAWQLLPPVGPELDHDLSVVLPMDDSLYALKIEYGTKLTLQVIGLLSLVDPGQSRRRLATGELSASSNYSVVLRHDNEGYQIADEGTQKVCDDCGDIPQDTLGLVAAAGGASVGGLLVVVGAYLWRHKSSVTPHPPGARGGQTIRVRSNGQPSRRGPDPIMPTLHVPSQIPHGWD